MGALHVTPATRAEWIHWADPLALGLGSNLLPCVPASPEVQVLEGSALAGKVGKIPSVFNSDGKAHGIPGWQKKIVTPEELARWSSDGRYNICLRTGATSGIYAIDIDIDAREAARRVVEAIRATLGDSPRRWRSNSDRCLIPVRVESAYKKKIIQTADGKVEVLGDGQQFVACGMHASGVRYDWTGTNVQGGLPQSFPTLAPAEFEALIARLQSDFGMEPAKNETPAVPAPGTEEVLTEISDDEWGGLLFPALRYLLPHAGSNDVWSTIGYGLLSLRNSRPVLDVWLDFSRKAAGYQPGAPEAWWQTHESQQPRSDWRHVLTLARQHGWREVSDPSAFAAVVPSTEVAAATDLMPPPPEKPLIRLRKGGLDENSKRLEELLSGSVYNHGGQLVKVIYGSHLAGKTLRAFDQPQLAALSDDGLRGEASKKATFQAFAAQRKVWEEADCPRELALYLLRQPEWTYLKPLEVIVQHPFMRPDGSICTTPGYDASSGALYVPNATFPALAAEVSRGDAAAALDTLLQPFSEFPYATEAAKSAFVAHVLTEVARLAIRTAPMFWYTAPVAGTGKSRLCDMAALIAHGTEPARRPWAANEEELSKAVTACLLAGDRSVAIDNFPSSIKVRSHILCTLLTAQVWASRRLGESENLQLPNRLVMSGSGNNITPVGDLARRSLVIRLDGNATARELRNRTFRIPDLPGYVTKHRTELLMAALTVLLGHQQNRCPGPAPLPSFEEWSRFVRDAVVWLGMEDPIDTQDDQTDDESEGLDEAFTLLARTYGGASFTSADVAQVVGIDAALTRVLIEARCHESMSSQKIGFWLGEHRDRIAGGLKLVSCEQSEKSKKSRRWKFVALRGPSAGKNGDLV